MVIHLRFCLWILRWARYVLSVVVWLYERRLSLFARRMIGSFIESTTEWQHGMLKSAAAPTSRVNVVDRLIMLPHICCFSIRLVQIRRARYVKYSGCPEPYISSPKLDNAVSHIPVLSFGFVEEWFHEGKYWQRDDVMTWWKLCEY